MLNHVRWNLTRKLDPFREADVLVISLGKSGRTWLRVMLHKYLSLRFDVPFDEIRLDSSAHAFPAIAYTHELAAHFRDDRWTRRLVGKSILPRSVTDSRQIVILSRDPRDVVVSSHFHKTQRSMKTDCSLEEFIHHPRWGIAGLVYIMNRWRRRFADHPNCHWLSYEALRADPRAEMERLLASLGIPVESEALEAAIEFARFDRMQAAEARGEFADKRLRPGQSDQPDSFKVRRGKVGGYRDYFDAAAIEFLDVEVAKLDPFYGYAGDGFGESDMRD
jgi:hypothetical protein